MKYFTTLRLLLLASLLLPMPGHAEMSIITLQHRTAERLIPLLQPVLDDGITISGQGAALIINSQPRQLEQLRPLIEQLDTPLQSLMISVIQGGSNSRSGLQGSVSGTTAHPRVNVYGSSQREKEGLSQQLRVVEGGWATIRSGESVPLTQQTIRHSPHGTTVQQSIHYKDVESGFEVRPRLSGEQVTLEIRASRARDGSGSLEQQTIATTVSGKLGEWIALGGISEQQQQSGIGILYATGNSYNATHNVKLKVERLPY